MYTILLLFFFLSKNENVFVVVVDVQCCSTYEECNAFINNLNKSLKRFNSKKINKTEKLI